MTNITIEYRQNFDCNNMTNTRVLIHQRPYFISLKKFTFSSILYVLSTIFSKGFNVPLAKERRRNSRNLDVLIMSTEDSKMQNYADGVFQF